MPAKEGNLYSMWPSQIQTNNCCHEEKCSYFCSNHAACIKGCLKCLKWLNLYSKNMYFVQPCY